MGEYTKHGLIYLPDIGESNTNKSTYDDALDDADDKIQDALKATAGPDSCLWHYISQAIMGRFVDAGGNKYFSTEIANGGNPGI